MNKLIIPIITVLIITVGIGAFFVFPKSAFPGPPLSASRYLSLNIWDWEANNFQAFEEIVDSVKEKGFNTISLSFAWRAVESSPNEFDFEWIDKRVDYIVKQGLKVVLRVSYAEPPEWIDKNYFMKEENGKIYEKYGKKILVIADPQVREWMERLLVKTVKRYQNRYASNPIVYYSIPFTPDEESEYAHTSFLDYSPQAQEDFRQWLQNKYSTINNLNKRWKSEYSAFSEVTIPESAKYGSSAWIDWMKYRTFTLKRLFDQLAKVVHNVDQNAKIGVQFGSVWDFMGGARGSYDAAKLIENVDWLIQSDVPCNNHKFSTDLFRTIARGKRIRISNELGSGYEFSSCDGYGPEELVLNHALQTFEYGGDMVHFANWERVFKYNNLREGLLKEGLDPEKMIKKLKALGYKDRVRHINQPLWTSALSKIAQAAKKPVSIIKEPKAAIYVSTMMQYLYMPPDVPPGSHFLPRGVDTYAKVKETYQMLTKNETQPIAIVIDSLLVDEPALLNRYTQGVYLPAFNRIISDEVCAAFRKATVPLYAENRDVGIKNEYGDSRTPEIFKPYSIADGRVQEVICTREAKVCETKKR